MESKSKIDMLIKQLNASDEPFLKELAHKVHEQRLASESQYAVEVLIDTDFDVQINGQFTFKRRFTGSSREQAVDNCINYLLNEAKYKLNAAKVSNFKTHRVPEIAKLKDVDQVSTGANWEISGRVIKPVKTDSFFIQVGGVQVTP
ncbi:hypothetical protein [Vibrio sp. D431a]|uniref:hypothetical protein n=1 Tax=Vibrio sp. D431a TaxID=2837388 RepID=UPI0025553070|nr:hypothetical protein [Vibrio sp. D431a]MDK9793347.1 hypothetical protein [Vibrio sp. D431a]